MFRLPTAVPVRRAVSGRAFTSRPRCTQGGRQSNARSLSAFPSGDRGPAGATFYLLPARARKGGTRRQDSGFVTPAKAGPITSIGLRGTLPNSGQVGFWSHFLCNQTAEVAANECAGKSSLRSFWQYHFLVLGPRLGARRPGLSGLKIWQAAPQAVPRPRRRAAGGAAARRGTRRRWGATWCARPRALWPATARGLLGPQNVLQCY